MSISEGLDRCVDDFTNTNEDVVADQTESHQLMENRLEDEVEGDCKRSRKYTEKGLQYQRSVLMDIRSELHKRLINIRYHAETLELEEKVAKSKAKVKEEARMEILR